MIIVSNLVPDTAYDVYCFGTSEYGDIGQSMLSTMKRIQTEKGKFEISNIVIKGQSISFSLNSNIPMTATCILFDEQCSYFIY